MHRSSVLLPDPEGPITQVASPAATSRSISCRTSISPKRLLSRRTLMAVSLMPPRMRQAFEIFSDLVTIATCVVIAIFAWPVMTMLAELDQRSQTANIPLVIPQGAVPIGLLLTALLIAVRLYVHGVRHDDVISTREIER